MAIIKTILKKIYDSLTATIITYGAVNVGTDATEILPIRLARAGLIIQNVSDKDVYIGGTDTVTTVLGLKLEPGDIYENQLWVGVVYGIVAAGVASVRYQDFYNS